MGATYGHMQIDILAGHVRAGVSGEMTLNGLPLRAADFQKRSCYVLQRDVLLATATVRLSCLPYHQHKVMRAGRLRSNEDLGHAELHDAYINHSLFTKLH